MQKKVIRKATKKIAYAKRVLPSMPEYAHITAAITGTTEIYSAECSKSPSPEIDSVYNPKFIAVYKKIRIR